MWFECIYAVTGSFAPCNCVMYPKLDFLRCCSVKNTFISLYREKHKGSGAGQVAECLREIGKQDDRRQGWS